jgi:hypothetical protein
MIKNNQDQIITELRKKMNREMTGQDLVNIASETVSTVEGGFGLGLEYEDIVDVVCELFIEKFGVVLIPEEITVLDKLE